MHAYYYLAAAVMSWRAATGNSCYPHGPNLNSSVDHCPGAEALASQVGYARTDCHGGLGWPAGAN